MATDESGKLDVKKLLSEILTKVNKLEGDLNKEVEARRDLAESATETLTDFGKSIESLQQGLFAMLSMHIDIVGPRRTHPDPDVAAEASDHAELAMNAQAWVAPTLFENLYGIGAETGEPLPGREVGVALDNA